MKLKEILEQNEVKTDDKARRRTNVSATQANITADEIESGVTIERLMALNVPVFQYGTQITIHGTLPEFSEFARPAGYKSIIKNGNKTVGVKYVAIDAEKKEKLVSMRHLAGRKLFTPTLNSQGLEMTAFFETKEECLNVFRAFPKDLYAGNVLAAAGFYGGFYIIASIGAIPEKNFWNLANYFYGIPNETEYNRIKEEYETKQRIEAEERKRKHEAAQAKANEETAAKLAEAAANINLDKITEVPNQIGNRFVVLHNGTFSGVKPYIYLITKKVFGKLHYARTEWNGGNKDFTANDASDTGMLEKRIKTIQARASQGYLWKV